MAKLGIALCILIVACGVQGLNIPSPLEAIEFWVEQQFQFAEFVKEKLEEGLQTLEAFVVSQLLNTIGDVQDAIDDWKKQVEDISAASEIGRECVSSSVDLEETGKNYVSNVTSCFVDAVKEIKSDHDTIKSSLEDFTATVFVIQNELESCKSFWFWQVPEILKCSANVVKLTGKDIATNVAILANTTESFRNKTSNLQDTAKSCAGSGVYTIIKNDVAESVRQIKKCIDDAKSS